MKIFVFVVKLASDIREEVFIVKKYNKERLKCIKQPKPKKPLLRKALARRACAA